MTSWQTLYLIRNAQLVPVRVFYHLDTHSISQFSIPDFNISTDIKISDIEQDIIENTLLNMIVYRRIFI
jgi:hypothetical protein